MKVLAKQLNIKRKTNGWRRNIFTPYPPIVIPVTLAIQYYHIHILYVTHCVQSSPSMLHWVTNHLIVCNTGCSNLVVHNPYLILLYLPLSSNHPWWTSHVENKENIRKIPVDGYGVQWSRHFYFLVVLRISAILWNERKSQYKLLFEHKLAVSFPKHLFRSRSIKQDIFKNTKIIIIFI